MPREWTLGDAAAHLTLGLATATDAQAAAIQAILTQGAGLLPLPEGAVLQGPEGLVPSRREAWVTLVDALRLDAVGHEAWDPDAPVTLIRAGAWESVLATLVLERDWVTIERTAAELEGRDLSASAPDALTTPEETLRAAGVDDARQAAYQRKMSALLAGRPATRGEEA